MSLIKELWAYKLKHFHQLSVVEEAVSSAQRGENPESGGWKKRYLRLYASEGDVLPKLRYFEGKALLRRSRGTLSFGRDCLILKDSRSDRVMKIQPTHGKPSVFMFANVSERDEMLALLKDMVNGAAKDPAPPSAREARQAERRGVKSRFSLKRASTGGPRSAPAAQMQLKAQIRAAAASAPALKVNMKAGAAWAAEETGSTSSQIGPLSVKSGGRRMSASASPHAALDAEESRCLYSVRALSAPPGAMDDGGARDTVEYSSDSSDDENCSEMSELIVGEYNEDMLEFTGPEDGDLLPLSDAELAEFGVARDELYSGSALVMLPVPPASSAVHNATAGVTLGFGSVQGRRKTMEDRHVVLPAFGAENTAYWGVCVMELRAPLLCYRPYCPRPPPLRPAPPRAEDGALACFLLLSLGHRSFLFCFCKLFWIAAH